MVILPFRRMLMHRMDTDTIVAPATLPGSGAISIVRISGPRALETVSAVVTCKRPLDDAPGYSIRYGTALQDDARNGVLQKAMRGYISWIAQQADTLPERLKTLFLKYRDMVRKQCTGVHDRAPEAVACILLGYAMMLDYFRAVNQIDTDTAGAMLEHAFTVLTDVSRKQAEATENEKPTRIFLDGLAELLASKTAALKDISPNIPPDEVKDPSLVQDMLGYMDNDYYYFLPAKAYGAVSRLCREQGVEFPVSFKALCKELKTDGIITAATMDKESATKVKKIDGRPVRLLWVPRTAMDGPKLINEQMKMEFTPVTPADNPFA